MPLYVGTWNYALLYVCTRMCAHPVRVDVYASVHVHLDVCAHIRVHVRGPGLCPSARATERRAIPPRAHLGLAVWIVSRDVFMWIGMHFRAPSILVCLIIDSVHHCLSVHSVPGGVQSHHFFPSQQSRAKVDST